MSDSEQAAACRRVLESTIAMRISARQSTCPFTAAARQPAPWPPGRRPYAPAHAYMPRPPSPTLDSSGRMCLRPVHHIQNEPLPPQYPTGTNDTPPQHAQRGQERGTQPHKAIAPKEAREDMQERGCRRWRLPPAGCRDNKDLPPRQPRACTCTPARAHASAPPKTQQPRRIHARVRYGRVRGVRHRAESWYWKGALPW